MGKTALMAAVPALLSGAEGASGLDMTSVIQTMMTSAQTQIYAILGIVAPVVGAITVAIVLLKFGTKWIRKLGSA